MPSLFPRQNDIIPFLSEQVAQIPNSNTVQATRIPADLLSRIYDALTQIEKHTGFSFSSAGDTRVDGTTVAAGAVGHTLAQLNAVYRVPTTANGKFALITDWTTIFDEAIISNARPFAAPDGDIPSGNPTPIMRTQGPLTINARRLNSTLSDTQRNCAASIFPNPEGKPVLALSTTSLSQPFTTNEAIQIVALFWGGV